ncbi:hypothetical protein TGAM01_v203658 [Trichoderma gamsii]|uniref:CHAT domain-containing protein n=1 Tax=Trichoderma gamsii TaxID=398673 RepID=A0A2P4ZSM8_9HYPO|nr:hypothetical protein TGAM01_v203658 [Trichoderma gamsii]PON27277.1 hypothetical protein TGAM01_v203658 [Trichoderma gamsii]
MEEFTVGHDMLELLNSMDTEELREFAVLQEDSSSNTSMELLVCIRYLIYQKEPSTENLDQAVRQGEAWVISTAPSDADLAKKFKIVGRRYERMGDLEDLNQSVRITGMAVEATNTLDETVHPSRCHFLNNYGMWLGRRFERLGNTRDLDEAIQVTNEAKEATSHTDLERAGRLSNLGHWLAERFERFGATEDLDWAASISEEAVRAAPPGHIHRASALNNCGGTLLVRFNRTHHVRDIDRAIEMFTIAAEITPYNHQDRARQLSMLACCLGYRSQFFKGKSDEDINRAVKIAYEALEVTGSGDPERALWKRGLADLLYQRFEKMPLILVEDLNLAIDFAKESMTETISVRNLSEGPIHGFDEIILYLKEGWNCRDAPPGLRIYLARQTAYFLNLQSKWEESIEILQKAVELLPALSARSLQHTDKEFYIANFAGLASMAAATALNAGKTAVEALTLLELGRGIISGMMLLMHAEVSDLKEQHPDLAEQFFLIREKLNLPVDWTPLSSLRAGMDPNRDQARFRREAESDFTELIQNIRQQEEGFENFLCAPTSIEMMAAAEAGPVVVINVAGYRCDALLIMPHEIQVLPLPALTVDDIEKKTRLLRRSGPDSKLLEWLWDVLAEPVLGALGFTQPPSGDCWPHIWWILTGKLSQLPVHAAGKHDQGLASCVMGRVVSSYSLSIKSLIYGRRRKLQQSTQTTSGTALLVSMPKTAGQTSLSFALEELDKLESLCPSLQLKPVKPPRRRRCVLGQMSACQIFHFAGHGKSDPYEPSKSCLLLDDWKTEPLTVGDLRNHKLHENMPFLAYLSACHTGANNVDSLVDEGIHLVGAFQLAGFRHAVGTLWEVSDRHCVNMAEVLYKTIVEKGSGSDPRFTAYTTQNQHVDEHNLHFTKERAREDGNTDKGGTRH